MGGGHKKALLVQVLEFNRPRSVWKKQELYWTAGTKRGLLDAAALLQTPTAEGVERIKEL